MSARNAGDRPGTGFERPAPAGYRIGLYAEQESVSAEDLVGFWETESGMDRNEAQRRVGEVLLVATAPDRELAAVSTAYIDRDPVLHLDLWHYRTFVAAAHRKANLAATMAVFVRDHLEQLFVSGAESRAAGILSEVHHPGLKSLNRAVWRQTGFTFIGEDARGSHIRVHYFPGARAPEPPR